MAACTQTANNSAKYAKLFPLPQFKDVGSMTFVFIAGDQKKTRRKVGQFGTMIFFFFGDQHQLAD